jgi:hypothetical protein
MTNDNPPPDLPPWLAGAYGTSNETALDYDRDTREWVRRHFPKDPHAPVA